MCFVKVSNILTAIWRPMGWQEEAGQETEAGCHSLQEPIKKCHKQFLKLSKVLKKNRDFLTFQKVRNGVLKIIIVKFNIVFPYISIPNLVQLHNYAFTAWIEINFRFCGKCFVFIPDPRQWSVEQVLQWLRWAVKEFSLEGVIYSSFSMTGTQLIDLGRDEFLRRAPMFVGDILLEHLEILQRG